MNMGDLGGLYVATWCWKTEYRVFLVPKNEWSEGNNWEKAHVRDEGDVRKVVEGIVGQGGTIEVQPVEFVVYKGIDAHTVFEFDL